MDDPRLEILLKVDLGKCRILLSESPIVLLCGGHVKEKERASDPTPPIQSFRHAITRTTPSYEIFRPEEIDTWHHDGVYKNLMDFEADLASICTLVVIVLESPGSIAELGAFSQLEDLSKKLIVIKSSEYNDAPSFINLGLLRYIERENETGVKVYPWDINNPTMIRQEVIDDAVNDISEELTKLVKSHLFKQDNNTHLIVLICGLINLFLALKESEILKYLKLLEINNINAHQLRSKLFLLEEFRIIKKKTYGGASFFVLDSMTYHTLRLAHKCDEPLDTLRMPIECLSYYNSINDRHRLRIINSSPRMEVE